MFKPTEAGALGMMLIPGHHHSSHSINSLVLKENGPSEKGRLGMVAPAEPRVLLGVLKETGVEWVGLYHRRGPLPPA